MEPNTQPTFAGDRKERTVPRPHEQRSEVARLLAQINGEYEAARQGLSGLAQGTSQHLFMTKRMEQIAELHSQLWNIVGDEAMTLVSDLELDQISLATAHLHAPSLVEKASEVNPSLDSSEVPPTELEAVAVAPVDQSS
jgi:hypothetical protein